MILLSAYKEREYVSLIASNEMAGWSYVLKQSVTDSDALVWAIEGAACGLVVMDQGVVNSMMPRKGSDTAGLTQRQQEVLSMMANGYNNSAIADKLVLGTSSVENYMNAIPRTPLGPQWRPSSTGPSGLHLHPRRRLGEFPVTDGDALSR